MGRSWLPEHSVRDHSPTAELAIPGMVFLPESDNEDQDVQIESNALENDGYQLLTDHDAPGHLEIEENDEDEDMLEEESNQRVPVDDERDASEFPNSTDNDKMDDSPPHEDLMKYCELYEDDWFETRFSKNSSASSISALLSVRPKITHPPRDIEVNFDQVRAAMVNVTLPVGSIPVWAAEVPDSEWGTFLQSRIKSLQQGNASSKELKP